MPTRVTDSAGFIGYHVAECRRGLSEVVVGRDVDNGVDPADAAGVAKVFATARTRPAR